VASYYGVIFPEFWTGRTGRELRERGGKDAQLLGLYLASNRHANMLGLYRLLVDDIRHETGLGVKAIERGYESAAAAGYAKFDAGSSYVWVLNMARFRLGLQIGDVLHPDDKRLPAIARIYHALDPNPFLGDFFDVNQKILRLKKRRDPIGVVVPFSAHHKMSPLEGAMEALPSQVQRSRSGISNRDQVSDEKPRRKSADVPNGPEADRIAQNEHGARLVAKVLRDALAARKFSTPEELRDDLEARCQALGLSCDRSTVERALDLVGSNTQLFAANSRPAEHHERPIDIPKVTHADAKRLLDLLRVDVSTGRVTRAGASRLVRM